MKNSQSHCRKEAICFIVVVFAIMAAGCGDNFWDPTQLGRFRPVPSVNIILDSLGVAEETPSEWEGAEQPRPVDAMVLERDYAFGSGDIVRISIFELLVEGVSFSNDYVITETGRISVLEVGVVQAAGLTEAQLEEEIKKILTPGILRQPQVTVVLLRSERRMFSIYGEGIARPNRYPIPRTDFRLADAIATGGGIGQFNTSYIYVSRAVTGREAVTEPAEFRAPEALRRGVEFDIEKEMLEIIAPRAQRLRNDTGALGLGLVVTSSEMITDTELTEAAAPEGFEVAKKAPASQEEPQRIDVRDIIGGGVSRRSSERIEWIFEDGRWVPMRVGERRPSRFEPERFPGPAEEMIPEDFGWEQIGTAGVQRRLIKIQADRLRAGDPRYNIIIRPSDSIHVPVDVTGEYFIMGNTNFQGAVQLLGRPITLKMAIAAAGGLGPLAWPKRCEVIRRIGENKEEIVMIDLDKIAKGEQPDFFIKPLDLINVGTHATARWRAVLRNAFRATYGFGFIYDRNFADRDFGTGRPFSSLVGH